MLTAVKHDIRSLWKAIRRKPLVLPESRRIVTTEAEQARVDTVTQEEKPGLRECFRAGEMFPLKGLWLKIESVGYDTATIKYSGITKKLAARRIA